MIFRLTERALQTKYGTFRGILYYDGQKESIALVMGNIENGANVMFSRKRKPAIYQMGRVCEDLETI